MVKVKEPQAEEWSQLRADQILFTYLHLAADLPQAQALCRSQCVAIGYETVTAADGSLPLLTPMSEVAGRMAVQVGASYLQQPMGGYTYIYWRRRGSTGCQCGRPRRGCCRH